MPTFTPPVYEGISQADSQTDRPMRNLMHHYGGVQTGYTVYKDQADIWHRVVSPTDETLAAAKVYYLGGHEYTVSEADAAELIAAGFEVDLGHALIINFAGGYITTPDHTDFDIGTSELDVQVFGIGAQDWAPIFLSNWVVAKGTSTTVEWAMTFHAFEPRFAIYNPGGVLVGFSGLLNESIGIPGNVPYGARMRVTPENGDGYSAVDYYTSQDGDTWLRRFHVQQLHSDLGGWTGFANDVGDLTIPGANGGLPWMVKVFWVKIFKDGVLVANPDMRQLAAGTTNFVDSVGKPWTLVGPATIG